jgi:RHS repeat-associated protein
MAPLDQFLGHPAYAGVANVVSQPIVLPAIDVAHATDFSTLDTSRPISLSNPALPGVALSLPAASAMGVGNAPFTGKLSLTSIPTSAVQKILPQGIVAGVLEIDAKGLMLDQPVQITLPNTGGAAPGAKLNLYTMNMLTGSSDLVGHFIVSADGKSMTSDTGVMLGSGSMPAMTAQTRAMDLGPVIQPFDGGGFVGNTSNCVVVTENSAGQGSPNGFCNGCQPTTDSTANPGNTSAATSGGYAKSNPGMGPNLNAVEVGSSQPMDSDAGLVTGEYFQDRPLVTYQSQGEDRGIDLQYSSLQANPKPVVQFDPSTQVASNAANITSVTAQATLGGVVQGSPVTYTTSGLTDESTYRVPLQVDATQLASGSYPYDMAVTQHYSDGSAAGTDYQGYVDVVNRDQGPSAVDPLGAGWSIAGLEQLYQPSANGPALITAGSQGTERFDPVYAAGQGYFQDLTLSSSADGTQVLANDGMGQFTAGTAAADQNTKATAAGDFNGDGRPDLASISDGALEILLNNGSGGFTVASSYVFSSGDIAKAIAVGNFTGHTNGTLDIAVLVDNTTSGSARIAVFAGNGAGNFAAPVNTTVGSGGLQASNEPMAVGDFNGDNMTDIAFVTTDGHVSVFLATAGGAMTSGGTLALNAGHHAVAVTTADYNGDGHVDLVVESNNDGEYDAGGDFVDLDLYAGNGAGGFSFIALFDTGAHASGATAGLAAGYFDAFGGNANPLQVAVPLWGDSNAFVDIVALRSNGIWGPGALIATPAVSNSPTIVGNIVAADLNGAGKPSIAFTDGTGKLELLIADPDSNQLLPLQSIPLTGADDGVLAAAPFMHHVAAAGYRAPMGDTSTLVHNGDGTWTRTYSDSTVLHFDSTGRETSSADRNGNTTSYAYVTSGPAAGALQTITDPVGLVTTLAYSSVTGKLTSVTDPASRVTNVTVDANGNLTLIQDPNTAVVTQYGYATPSNHLLTTETNPDNHTATAHYNGFGMLSSETLLDGTSSVSINPALGQGLVAAGGTGALPLPSSFQGSVTDADGDTTTLGFDAMDHPTAVHDAVGNPPATYVRDPMTGWVTSMTDAMNRTTSYTYDMMGNVASIALPPSFPTWNDYVTETLTYNEAFGVPTSMTDFNGNTTTFTLDSKGNVTRRTDPDTLHEDYTYNSAGQVLTDSDRNGNTTTYTYDSKGRLSTVTYPGTGSPTVHYGYDAAGNLTSVMDELNQTTTYTYDPDNRLLTSQDPDQAAAGKLTSYVYDSAGNLTSLTDALGHVTTYSYDSRSRLTGMTDPANQGTGKQYSYAYDGAGNLTSVTDPLGDVTSYTYDSDHRLLSETTYPDGTHPSTTSYAYDADGELASSTDPNLNTTDYTYTNRNRLTQAVLPPRVNVDPGPVSTGFFAYDGNGNLTSKSDALGNQTKYSYDSLNRLQTASTFPDGTNPDTTTYGYDANGNKTSVTDGLGHTTSYGYDARNRLTSVTEPAGGGTTTYTYDAASRLTSVADPKNNVTTYGYDAANRVVTETDPLNHTTTYVYDLVGNLTKKTDRNGHVTEYTYDADNRLATETWDNPGGGSPLNVVTITYDAAGRETKIGDAYSSYTYTYDDANRLTSVDNAGTPNVPHMVLTNAYDAAGNRTSLSDSLGGLNTYTYDAWNELTGLAQSGTGVSGKGVTFGYDQAGRLTGLSRFSNASLNGTGAVLSTTYTYDQADRLTGITHALPNATVVASYAYTLDAADRLTSESRTWTNPGGGTSSDTLGYTYTNNNQLTSVTHTNSSFANESFSYDANGNRNMTGYSTGTGNELTSDGTYNYTYDNEGNQVTKTAIATGNETTHTYDFRNRLAEVDQVAGGVRSVIAQYTYDALDRRIGVSEGGTATWTVYSGIDSDPLMDFNGAGSLAARYLSGPSPAGVDQVLARDTPTGGVAWYLGDRLRTIRDLINNSGTVIDHIDYGAFGNVIDETNQSTGDRFKYTGMQYDVAVPIYFDSARWYDLASARFTSQDPGEFGSGDTNFYRYVANQPTNLFDFNGLAADDPDNQSMFANGLVASPTPNVPPAFALRVPLPSVPHIGTAPYGSMAGIPLVCLSAPTTAKPRTGLGGPTVSKKTSLLSSFLRKLVNLLPKTWQRLPFQLPAPTASVGGLLSRTANLGGLLARWAAHAGLAGILCDVASVLAHIVKVSPSWTPQEVDALYKTIN